MTHEELLTKIDYYLKPTIEMTGDDRIKNSAIGFMKALRAVVELHKPFLTDYPSYCLHCETYGSVVPCPTIQAIEKELS